MEVYIQHFSCQKFSHVIDAESDYFFTIFKIISNAEMCAAYTSTENEIKVTGKNNEDNSGQLYTPAHLTHRFA